MSGSVFWPNGSTTKPRVTSRFGPRAPIVTPNGTTQSFHRGTDLVGFSIICAPVDGYVSFAAYNGGFGNFVRIVGDDGNDYGHAHIAPNGFMVSKGQRVKRGQPIAIMGTTGNSTGVHLHWEVYAGRGAAVDAEIFMQSNAAPAGGGATPFDPEKPKEWDEMATKDEIKDAVREVLGEKMVAPAVSIVPLTDGKIYLFSALTGRRAYIGSPYHVQIIQRALDNNSNDTMLSGELDIVAGYLVAVNPPAGATVDTEALAARLAELDASDDAATVKAAVKEALADTVGEIRFPI